MKQVIKDGSLELEVDIYHKFTTNPDAEESSGGRQKHKHLRWNFVAISQTS